MAKGPNRRLKTIVLTVFIEESNYCFIHGEVAERFNAAVLKTVVGASPPRVRISASPPIIKKMKHSFRSAFFVADGSNGARLVFAGQSSSSSVSNFACKYIGYLQAQIRYYEELADKTHQSSGVFCLAFLSANNKKMKHSFRSAFFVKRECHLNNF